MRILNNPEAANSEPQFELAQVIAQLESSLQNWDSEKEALATESRFGNNERVGAFLHVLSEAEFMRTREYLASENGFYDFLKMIREYESMDANSLESETAVAQRAKKLLLWYSLTVHYLTYNYPTGVLTAQKEAKSLKGEYGSFAAIPDLLKKRYISALEEEQIVRIMRDHNFVYGLNILDEVLECLYTLDADRFNTDASIVAAETSAAIVHFELGNDAESFAALKRAEAMACKNMMDAVGLFSAYLTALNFQQKLAAREQDGDGLLSCSTKLSLILKSFDGDDADPALFQFCQNLLAANQRHALLIRRNLQKSLLEIQLITDQQNYMQAKNKLVLQWEAELQKFGSAANELEAKKAELLTAEARHFFEQCDTSASQAAYKEAIQINRQIELNYHAAEIVFEYLNRFKNNLDRESAEAEFLESWALFEDKLGKSVMEIFSQQAEFANVPQLKNIEALIRFFYSENSRDNAEILQKALRASAKFLEQKRLVTAASQAEKHGENASEYAAAIRSGFDANLLIIDRNGQILHADQREGFDEAYFLGNSEVQKAIADALQTGLPQQVKNVFATEYCSAIENAVFIALGEQVFIFDRGNSQITFSETERALLAISVVNGFLATGNDCVDSAIVKNALLPKCRTDAIANGTKEFAEAERVIKKNFWEVLGLELVTHGDYLIRGVSADGQIMGGTVVKLIGNNDIPYAQVFFGDEVWKVSGIDPNLSVEIGSAGIEPMARQTLMPQIFLESAQLTKSLGRTHGIMVLNSLMLRWFKKAGIPVLEIGRPDIHNPETSARLKNLKNWSDVDIEKWTVNYFDKLAPILAAVAADDVINNLNL